MFSLQFLSELTKLFQKARSDGSVTMTMKRCKYFQPLLKFLNHLTISTFLRPEPTISLTKTDVGIIVLQNEGKK